MSFLKAWYSGCFSDNFTSIKTDGEDETAGIDDVENNTGIVIYPNPATSTIQFESSNGKALGDITVYDNLGRVVFQKEGIRTDTFSADVSRLSTAVYQYQLKDVFGKTYFRGKFLKQ